MRHQLGWAVAAVLAATTPAFSQTKTIDIPTSAYGPVWTGFYVGAAFGTDMLIDRTNLTGGGATLNNDLGGVGALGSIYGGVDYQIVPRMLVGMLAELTYGGVDSAASASALGATATLSTHADWSWAALVRAGVLPSPSTLLYALGGYTGQNIQTTANAGPSFSQSNTFNGWTVGAGIETMLGNGWSTKFEYRYSQYETKTLPGTTLTLSPSTHAARVGLTYHFGGFGAPVAAQDAPPASAEPAKSWTGFYAGVAGGAGAMTDRLNATLGNASANVDNGGDGIFGGFFGGADYQVAPQALVGVMGDYMWTGIQSNSSLSLGGTTATASVRQKNNWSILGRLGFLATPSTLLYAAGGYTNATFTSTVNLGGVTVSHDDVLGGWTLGPGIELMLGDGWATRLEYRYSQFAAAASGGLSGQATTQTVRAGLAYHFGVQ